MGRLCFSMADALLAPCRYCSLQQGSELVRASRLLPLEVAASPARAEPWSGRRLYTGVPLSGSRRGHGASGQAHSGLQQASCSVAVSRFVR